MPAHAVVGVHSCVGLRVLWLAGVHYAVLSGHQVFHRLSGLLYAIGPVDQELIMAKPVQAFSLSESLLRAFDTNDRINQYLVESLPAEAWRAPTPDGKGRTIAAIVAHMHNVRRMWLKAVAEESKIPEQLDRTSVTPAHAAKALERSREALRAVLKAALETDGRVKGFRPDVSGFFGYLIAHDAHHRGQICMLARQVGHALPQKAMFGMWEWGTRGKV